jgi:hemerythrin
MIPSKLAGSSNFHSAIGNGITDGTCPHPDWALDISSGVPAMDRLHHDLFSALDELSDSDDAAFCEKFTTFVGRVERVFREEEAWMDELDFQETAAHQEQHARVLGALHHIHAQVMDGDVGLGRHVADELLPQWLLVHISTMDSEVAAAMQCARSEGALFLQPS